MMIKMFNEKISSLGMIVMAAMLIEMAAAANYTVGAPNGGWDQSTDLQTWASSITFSQGDNLIFEYTTNHDVTEVSKPDFDSCSSSNPLQPPLTGGSAVVPLTSAGSRYFMCSTGGHCLSGMKVSITIRAAASAPPPPSPTTDVASPPPSAPPRPSTPAAAALPPSPTPDVPSPPPKHSPPKTVAPSLSPKNSPPPAASAPPPPSVSSLPPAPSSAAKFGVMGGITVTCLIVMINLLINI